MRTRDSKTLALLGGVATLALGSALLVRVLSPGAHRSPERCAPRLLELERAVCEPSLTQLSARPH